MPHREPSLPAGVARLRRGERGYPRLLGKIGDPPEVLYVRGELPRGPAVAVVGSRECTAYGRRIAYRLAVDIARCGFVVVSGLARGIDAEAHRGSLDGDGKTVAVLPTGIDRIYPPSNTSLARRIERAGAIITEFEPRTTPFPSNFHQRNRIIAGMAVATVVIEAARRSGTKITVKYALEYDREVLAVPGPIDSRTSEGANELILEGAAPCTGIDSLLLQLPDWARQRAVRRLDAVRRDGTDIVAGLPAPARAVLAAIPADRSCGVDHLVAATGLPVARLLAALTDIEARGLIRSVSGQRYERM
ncbi:MAG: DNA-processing protein DprA [Acidobacteriota bacterium]|jgi:DNA processing protein